MKIFFTLSTQFKNKIVKLNWLGFFRCDKYNHTGSQIKGKEDL